MNDATSTAADVDIQKLPNETIATQSLQTRLLTLFGEGIAKAFEGE